MPGARVLKRRKTPLACEFCRRHKIKCDGIHPICGNCSRRGRARDQCVWKHIDGRLENVPESNTFVRQLEQRIQQLESHAWSNPQLAQPATETIGRGLSEMLASPAAASVGEESPGCISAMEGAVTNAPQSEGYIGSASAAYFMNFIRRAVDPGSAVSGPIQNVNTPPTRDTASSSALRKPSMPYVLPPRRDAERLVIAYWDYIHPLYPFLYQPCFADIFVSLWTGKPSSSEAASPLMRTTKANSACLVNLVLALACQYYDVPVDRQDLTEGPKSGVIFFNRARSIFQYDVSDGTDQSLQVVQIFLLMAQYLNSTGSPQRSWELLGVAIRICQRLGLHQGATTDQRAFPDPVEREMIKRVWHGCFMMERMLCATLGRPTMVTAAEADPVPFPEELDEGAFQSGRRTLTYAPMSTLSFFVYSAKLFKMVHLILLAFYSDENSNGARDYNHYFMGPTSIFDIDSQMMKWLAAIPDYIQLESYSLLVTEEPGHTQVFRRQAVVLRIRFLQARIFLFRPVLAKMCVEIRGMDSQHAGSLAHRTALQCSMLCVKAAIEMIEVVNNHQTTAAAWGHEPSWLYVVLHIYLAATVLLAARLSPIVLLGEISKQEIQQSWNHALDILDRFQADNMSAKRCVAALNVLYQGLPGGIDAHGQREDGPESSGTTNLQGDAVVIGPADELFPHHPTLAGPPDDDFGQDLGSEWMPDFDFSNPYDMTWFQVTAPGLYTL
ncbi:fungal-specific transcription factor domain-containing protein [Ilyonectria destructans]|nr:fungal-specific transcription factor domain-containing protein [Ilyonectria destructans]